MSSTDGTASTLAGAARSGASGARSSTRRPKEPFITGVPRREVAGWLVMTPGRAVGTSNACTDDDKRQLIMMIEERVATRSAGPAQRGRRCCCWRSGTDTRASTRARGGRHGTRRDYLLTVNNTLVSYPSFFFERKKCVDMRMCTEHKEKRGGRKTEPRQNFCVSVYRL